MHNIQVEGVESVYGSILEDIRKSQLNDILEKSEQNLIENLINETELLQAQTKKNSTYEEKHKIFSEITNNWFNFRDRYKTHSEAIELNGFIDRLTNYSIAYSHLCLGLSLINEGRTGQYKDDLKRIALGFLQLSETIDTFFDYFSSFELKQVYSGAKNSLSMSSRSIEQYFNSDIKLSNLVTQLRAYSSLIILRIEEYADVTDLGSTIEPATDLDPWTQSLIGVIQLGEENPAESYVDYLEEKYL
jgi:hypothetical protein